MILKYRFGIRVVYIASAVGGSVISLGLFFVGIREFLRSDANPQPELVLFVLIPTIWLFVAWRRFPASVETKSSETVLRFLVGPSRVFDTSQMKFEIKTKGIQRVLEVTRRSDATRFFKSQWIFFIDGLVVPEDATSLTRSCVEPPVPSTKGRGDEEIGEP